MPPVDTQQTWTQARALHARTVKKYGKDSPEAAESLANFKACRLADYVSDVLAEAPPMSDERRQRIAALLLAGR
jgi:hypothetical protein